METERYRFLAIGSGLAGLTYALRVAKHGKVCVLTKAEVREANTSYAQGGIAAAIGEADSWALHEQDTLIAGAGLCDVEAVRFLVQNAPAAIEWLQNVGANFDTEHDGDLALGREGGHSRNRIVHHADNTGWEIERAVVEEVRSNPNITVVEHAFVTELIVQEGRCCGAIAMVEGLGQRAYVADAVLIATGGAGKVYMHTTNPPVATADGIALADRAGAEIRNMEFMQFHPTTLYHPQMRSFLITEAARGAGGTLRNHLGQRFMYDYDPRLELAPRDVVARAMMAEMKRLSTWCLYLDMTHLKREHIVSEFPTITNKLDSIGLKIYKEWIPVVPAQHYSCGGVKTDLQGQTTVPGLYAAGEVASTGVHGANRLASNSLLEALVFAGAAAEASLKDKAPKKLQVQATEIHCIPETEAIRLRRNLQHAMTEEAAIVRTTAGLKSLKRLIEKLTREFNSIPNAPYSEYSLETMNLLIAAKHVVRGALARKENVGLHFNEDLANGLTPSIPGQASTLEEEQPIRAR